ncbi:MAG: amidohydrolase family protein [Methylomicrobium sp.]|nr:amidohydrolase family protein [Methylomicrobium sp.]
MIIDGHRHITGDYQPILTEMDALGIAKTVLVGVGVRDLSLVTIHDSLIFRYHCLFRSLGILKARQLVNSSDFRNNLLKSPNNENTLKAIRERPDRFTGFAFLNPESPEVLNELHRCLTSGMQGIKLALVQYPSDLRGKNMINLCEVARTYCLPVFMHLGLTKASSDPDWLVETFSDVTFILAHAGVQRFEETMKLARKRNNVFVDTSSYIATSAKIRRLYKTIGAEKLIFGSDIPVMCSNESTALAKIEAVAMPDCDKARILGENLAFILSQVKTDN